jgi:putative transposase
MGETYKIHLHNPPHLFRPGTLYMVTGATLYKKRILNDDPHKALFCRILFERAALLGWELHAWAVLDNHYHFVAQSPEDPTTLVRLIREVHSISAIELNRLDNAPGRRVWYNYWDSCIDYETSYLARLLYVHLNPVKHGVVENADEYEFCSYRWFLECGESDFRKRVMEQPIDRVRIMDDF